MFSLNKTKTTEKSSRRTIKSLINKNIEKLREEYPANVEGSEEFNQSNSEEPSIDSAGFTIEDREPGYVYDFKNFPLIEPLKNNRFLINLKEVDIPVHYFRNYEIFNEGEQIIFVTEFLESVGYIFNPKDFFKIENVTIEYLDPVGNPVEGINFKVKGSNFTKKGDYADDSIQKIQLRFIVDTESIQKIYG